MARRLAVSAALLGLAAVGAAQTTSAPPPTPKSSALKTCGIYDSDWACPPYCTWDGRSCVTPRELTVQVASWLTSRSALGPECKRQATSANGVYHFEGYTASGAPFYRESNRNVHLYYDPSCDGGNTSARWIIGSSAPSMTAQNSLAGSAGCNGLAYYNSHAITGPPLDAAWKLSCTALPGQWLDMELLV